MTYLELVWMWTMSTSEQQWDAKGTSLYNKYKNSIEAAHTSQPGEMVLSIMI